MARNLKIDIEKLKTLHSKDLSVLEKIKEAQCGHCKRCDP
jgi:hypothetical protein